MTQKTYIPKSKAKVQPTSFGDVLKLGFHASSLIAFIQANTNQAGYINIDIVPRRQADDYGNTHSCVLSDWKPSNPNPEPSPRSAPAPAANASNTPQGDDFPF